MNPRDAGRLRRLLYAAAFLRALGVGLMAVLIGLYAARRLAESMGGRLWCEPAEGGGARFVLALRASAAV